MSTRKILPIIFAFVIILIVVIAVYFKGPPVKKTESKDPQSIIKMSRGECKETCPVYSLTINEEDYSVKFNGVKEVNIIGERSSNISKKKMSALVQKINDIKLLDLKDSPTIKENNENSITTLSYIKNGKSIEVRFTNIEKDELNHNLNVLADYIDFISNSGQWLWKQ